MRRKAQVAFEYMLVVMIALAFIVPVWAYISSVKTRTADELALSYAKSAVDRLASTADLIYSQGAPAKVKVGVYIPDGVEGFNITNDTIVLTMKYQDSTSTVFATSRAQLNGTLPTVSGNYWFEVKAVENEVYDVFISQV